VEVAPSERAFLEGFFLDIYTPRAHNDGTVDQVIEEVLAFPHKQTAEDIQRFLDAFLDHDTTERLPQIAAPSLVLAGGIDTTSRPELCRAVAELIPGAQFKVMEEESHQPFQEVPDKWNAIVDALLARDRSRRLNALPFQRSCVAQRAARTGPRRGGGSSAHSAAVIVSVTALRRAPHLRRVDEAPVPRPGSR
jgi:hypothetical protein